MNENPCWLLTDPLGETCADGGARLRWGRGINHGVRTSAIHGYRTDSVHLPYLLDPVFERYGPRARLWLSDIGEPCFEDTVRVASRTWTTLDEWRWPEWVESPAEVRVRLRFALLAVGGTHPSPKAGARLRTLSLANLPAAARRLEEIGAGGLQAVSLAAMAVRSAAPAEGSAARLMDMVSKRYPVYAWYSAMAAMCACTDLTAAAEAAVRLEYRRAARPVAEPVLA